MLVHISSKHDKITVISLPRDSLVTIPGHRSNGSEGAKGASVGERQGKLNWAYMYGGAPLTVQTVERATGVHVDHYVEVNFLGFLKVVNALGGVTVCTPQPINDPKSGLRLPAGKSNVDGPTALAYSRARYTLTGGSDLGRIDRQQQFMSAVVHKALSEPAKFPAFLRAALDAIRADKGLSKKDLSALAMQMRGMSTDSIAFTTVPLSNSNYMVPIGGQQQSTVLWDRSAGDRLFQEIDGRQADHPAAEARRHPERVVVAEERPDGSAGTDRRTCGQRRRHGRPGGEGSARPAQSGFPHDGDPWRTAWRDDHGHPVRPGPRGLGQDAQGGHPRSQDEGGAVPGHPPPGGRGNLVDGCQGGQGGGEPVDVSVEHEQSDQRENGHPESL